jgi:hypothetical protein
MSLKTVHFSAPVSHPRGFTGTKVYKPKTLIQEEKCQYRNTQNMKIM